MAAAFEDWKEGRILAPFFCMKDGINFQTTSKVNFKDTKQLVTHVDELVGVIILHVCMCVWRG